MRMQTHELHTDQNTISTQSATADALAALVRWQDIRKQKEQVSEEGDEVLQQE